MSILGAYLAESRHPAGARPGQANETDERAQHQQAFTDCISIGIGISFGISNLGRAGYPLLLRSPLPSLATRLASAVAGACEGRRLERSEERRVGKECRKLV